MYEKTRKAGFWRNAVISKPKKIFNSKIDTTILKLVTILCYNIKIVSSDLTEKSRVIERYCRARPGRAGPDRFITDIDYNYKVIRNIFYSIHHIGEIDSFRDIALHHFACKNEERG